jgi:hypothetical protein
LNGRQIVANPVASGTVLTDIDRVEGSRIEISHELLTRKSAHQV